MNGHAKKAIAHAEARGFVFDHVNCKGLRLYTHPNGAEVGINLGMDDRQCRFVMQRIDKATGVEKDRSQKHRPANIRERYHKQHQSAVEQREAHQKRLGLLIRAQAGDAAIYEAQAAFEAADRAVRELERLMRAPGAA